ncbi:MAG: GntG family PLP-dependent aldolase [Planctomycetota bacterium]
MTESAADFRSDTVTRPTPAMRRAMAEAEVGDDVLDGDPTVRLLEQEAARWLGKEGAWYVPSGTMANQVAAGVWTRPGDEVIAEQRAHIVLYESGALGYLHGVQTTTLRGERGALDPDELRNAVRPDFLHCPRTALVCVEQTNLESGGRVVPLDRLRAVRDVASELGLPVHMDGARLANAVAASGVPAAEWAACADSVSVCLSKGLGAPVGSIIAGDAAFLERAKLVRKRLGGWMRQAGILAAAGRIALAEGVERLPDDHRLARDLAERLDSIPGLSCAAAEVETNIVFVSVDDERFDAPMLSVKLEERGVRAMPQAERVLRCVTHRDVGPADVERLESALRSILSD